jgi:hypothetical protein
MVMFVTNDPNHHAHLCSHQDDKDDYADSTRPEQANVLRTPPLKQMAALNDLSSAA